MIASLLEKTLDCVHQSLNDAKLNPQDIHKIMLVGGATRTPLVHRLLHERLGLEPRFEINPDLIVAMGAAIQGGEKSALDPGGHHPAHLQHLGPAADRLFWGNDVRADHPPEHAVTGRQVRDLFHRDG